MSDSRSQPRRPEVSKAALKGGGKRRPGPGASAAANPEGSAERLKVFSPAQISKVGQKVGPADFARWPTLEGCLTILFSSRSGSTYLARELECAFDIGRLRESLNPNRVANQGAARVVAGRRDAWFSFKAGGTSVIAAELCGFFDAYLASTSFLLLVRRDIVAQAVSRVKAKQTMQWHSTQNAKIEPVYDGAKIAQSVLIIADGVERLRSYAEASGRPSRRVVYEDFRHGDFSAVMEACDDLGVPRLGPESRIRPQPVERIGDAINAAWAARFVEEAQATTRIRIDGYLARIDEMAS